MLHLLTNRPTLFKQYAISVSTVLLVAGICQLLSAYMSYKVIALVLLMAVSSLAVFLEIFPVLVAALLSALIWDFFFIPPRFTFTIASPEDALLLLMYFIIALVNGALTYKIRLAEKDARQKEEKANTVKLYNVLLNSLSHELRTPIATIIAATDNLQDNKEKITEGNRKDLVEEIAKASLRLNGQVENLLDMSRLETGFIRPKKDWHDINELVYDAVNKLDEHLRLHKVHIHIQDNIPLFRLDYGLTERAVYNLLINAASHTSSTSAIWITATHISEAALKMKVLETSRDELQITVADNGPGFPTDEVDKVFGKFYRLRNSRPGGTGLGLSIVKGFIEAQDGYVKLDNLKEGGAKFTIVIPAETSFIKNLKHE